LRRLPDQHACSAERLPGGRPAGGIRDLDDRGRLVGDLGVVAPFVDLAAIPSSTGEERAVADRVTEELRSIGLEVDECQKLAAL
jgi:hypothetical protein